MPARCCSASETAQPRTLVVAVAFSAIAVWLVRRRPNDAGPAALLATVGAAAAVLRATDPDIVPGIVWAFPLLVIGLAAAGRGTRTCPAVVRSAKAVVVFAVMVLVTQYSVGGGSEWGWRYVAVALPAVGAALAGPVVAVVDGARHRVPAIVAVAVLGFTALAIPLGGVLAQRRAVDHVDRLLDRTDAAFAAADAELIVAADPSFGRYVWKQSIAGHVVSTGRGEAELSELLGLLDDRGVERVLFVWVGDQPVLPVTPFVERGSPRTLLPRAYRAVQLEDASNIRSPS